MLVKKHQVKIVIPEHYDILNITHSNEQGLISVLRRISPTAMSNYHGKEPADGFPTLWCLDLDSSVMLYPRPDKEYELKIEYLPPSKTL